MLVREVMSTPAITVAASASVHDVLRVLDQHAITAVPVVDAGDRLVGVVSEADLVREAVLPDGRLHMLPIHLSAPARPRLVGEVMSTAVLTVPGGSDLSDAVDLLTSTTVKSLPVVEDGHVVGVVSRRDVVHLLARQDEAIRREIEDLVADEDADWTAGWAVGVADGVVTITGVTGEKERRIAEVLAGTVAGVVGVHVL